jgi:hypothetical protein
VHALYRHRNAFQRLAFVIDDPPAHSYPRGNSVRDGASRRSIDDPAFQRRDDDRPILYLVRKWLIRETLVQYLTETGITYMDRHLSGGLQLAVRIQELVIGLFAYLPEQPVDRCIGLGQIDALLG